MFTVNHENTLRIHENPGKGVIATTGGGTVALPILMDRGGASNTLLGVHVPYDPRETEIFLGYRPEKLASREVARQLCARAFTEALRVLGDEDTPAFGVGATSALQRTPEEREGRKHEIFVCAQSETGVAVEMYWSGTAEGDPESRRLEEEGLMGAMILNALAYIKGVESPCIIPEGFGVRVNPMCGFAVPYKFFRLEGMIFNFSCSGGKAEMGTNPCLSSSAWVRDRVVFPGSFNPLHEGHTRMLDTAEQMLGSRPILELCMDNADKPGLTLFDVWERVLGIAAVMEEPTNVCITRATRFVDKAEIFPGATFVCGYDTAVRVVNPRYANLEVVMKTFRDKDIRFLVFGREKDGEFRGGHDALPAWFSRRTVTVPEAVFRVDASSMQIREMALARSLV